MALPENPYSTGSDFPPICQQIFSSRHCHTACAVFPQILSIYKNMMTDIEFPFPNLYFHTYIYIKIPTCQPNRMSKGALALKKGPLSAIPAPFESSALRNRAPRMRPFAPQSILPSHADHCRTRCGLRKRRDTGRPLHSKKVNKLNSQHTLLSLMSFFLSIFAFKRIVNMSFRKYFSINLSDCDFNPGVLSN